MGEKFELLTKKLMSVMHDEGLAKMSFSDGCGNSATISKDKHGFYKAKYTLTKENIK